MKMSNRRVSRLKFTSSPFSPLTYRGNVRATRAPIPSDFVYRAYEILKRRVGYAAIASQTTRQAVRQAGRQAPLPQYAWRFVPGARCVYVYTVGPAREPGAGPSLLVMWCGVSTRAERNPFTFKPLLSR